MKNLNWYKVIFAVGCVFTVVGFTNFLVSANTIPPAPQQITIEYVPAGK